MLDRQTKIQRGAELLLEKEINAFKRGLVKRAAVDKRSENFGRQEVKWLKAKYNWAVKEYGLNEGPIFTLIDDFVNWCNSYFH